MNIFSFKKLFQILLVFLPFRKIISQNMSLITPICNNNTVSYSLYANISDYLMHNNNIDKREIINSTNELENKKIGILQGFPISNNFKEVIIYSNTEELIIGLKNHTLDGIVVDKSTNDYIILHNYDLYKIPEKIGTIQYGPIFQKDSQYKNDFEDFISKTNIQTIIEKWNGINYDSQKIDKNLNGSKGTLKATVFLGNRPYAYKDENGQPTGSCLDIIYSFANNTGYTVDFIQANSYDNQINAIKQKNADMTCSYITDSLKNDDSISFSQYFIEQDIFSIIRLSNSEMSNEDENKEYYESYKDLDGKKLGVLRGSVFEEITKTNFSHSDYINYNDTFLLYKAIITGEIEGFIIDIISAEDFQRRFPEKVSYFEENLLTNSYGFGFNKNNTQLVNNFNSFLSRMNLADLYRKWNVYDTSNLTVDKTINNSNFKIRVAMFPDKKPLCFEQNNNIIGYEIELLYEFARFNHCDIEFTTLENLSDKIDYIINDKADITGGGLIITEYRREIVSFSYPILTAGTSLVVQKEKRKVPNKIVVLDENYNKKTNNTIYFPVKVGDTDTTSFCVFPENYTYNEYILVNCTISDLKGVDPTTNGLKLGVSKDTLSLNNVEYNSTNLFNGNILLPGKNITVESNKTDYICYVDYSFSSLPETIIPSIVSTPTTTLEIANQTTIPEITTIITTTPGTTTNPTTIPERSTIPTTISEIGSNITNTTIIYNSKNNKSGLSSGTICAIVIPCVPILTFAAIASFLCNKGNAKTSQIISLPSHNFEVNSMNNLNEMPEKNSYKNEINQNKIKPDQMIQPESFHQIIPPSFPHNAEQQQTQLIPI